MKFNPRKDFMLVERVKPELKSGLVLPDKETDVANEELFRIVALPDGDDSGLKVGDQVVIVGYLNKFRWDGQDVILAKSKDVVMVLEV